MALAKLRVAGLRDDAAIYVGFSKVLNFLWF
jgi:hypothetical protein